MTGGRIDRSSERQLRAIAWLAGCLILSLAGWAAWIATLDGGKGLADGAGPTPFALAWAGTGLWLAVARPRNAVGWLLILIGALQMYAIWGNLYGSYGVGVAQPPWPLADWVAMTASFAYFPSLVLPGTVLLAIYPDGHLPARWWRWPVGAVVVALTVLTVAVSLSPDTYDDVAPGPPPVQLPDVGWLEPALAVVGLTTIGMATLVIWVATGVRLARAPYPLRQQLAWLTVAVVGLVASIFIAGGSAIGVFAFLLPIAVAVGVLRYGMLGLVLSRGLTYALLTAVVLLVYVAVTAVAGTALDRGPVPGITAAALVAVGLAPARERVQRGVNRFVYGERRDPLRAVAQLATQVADTTDDKLLEGALATVAEAVRSPGVSVLDAEGRVRATVGAVDDTEQATTLDLRVAGAEVGVLVVAPRAPGAAYSSADQRVLRALAPQVGVVVHALDLAGELEVERDRVVAATRAERDRLRRELHDSLGPSLTGAALGLRATSDALDAHRISEAERVVDRLRTEVDVAVADVRRIIDDLRPADLDDGGLEAALRRRAAALAPSVHVDVTVGPLPALPDQVEDAAYRIAGEALTNVARHSGASRACVEASIQSGSLVLRVHDDGAGIPTEVTAGVGLESMQRRAEALSGCLEVDGTAGGTTVVARLPLTAGG